MSDQKPQPEVAKTQPEPEGRGRPNEGLGAPQQTTQPSSTETAPESQDPHAASTPAADQGRGDYPKGEQVREANEGEMRKGQGVGSPRGANQDIVDVTEHNRLKALGIHAPNGVILPKSEHPTSGGNPNARRRDYSPGEQVASGSG